MRTGGGIGPARGLYLFLLVICVLILADRAVEFFAAALVRIRYPYELDYTEGSVLCQIQDLDSGAALYGKVGERPYTFTIYPPLYHVVVAALAAQIGDAVLAGRLLSFACAILLALVIAGLVHRLGAGAPGLIRWAAATIAALSFLATAPVFWTATLLRVDMLAMSLAACGLYVFFRSSGVSGHAVALLFFTLALLTKHSAIAAPAACILGTAVARPWSGLKLGLTFVLLAGFVFGVLGMIFGDTVFFHLFYANALSYSLLRAVTLSARFVTRYPVLVASGLAAFLHLVWGTLSARHARRACAEKWTLAVYFVVAWASVLAIGRVGTSSNHLIEVTIALCTFSGLAVLWTGSYLWAHTPRPASLARTALTLAVLLALTWQAAQNTYTHRVFRPTYHPRSLRASETLLDRIRATPGPVFGVTQFLVCRAGKPAQINTFMVAQLATVGTWDAGPFLDDIRRKEFALVFLDFDLMREHYSGDRFTPEMLKALREHYRPDGRIGAYRLYRPAGASPSAALAQ